MYVVGILTVFTLFRFDLIYLVLDRANEQTDQRLAKHLIALFWKDDERQKDAVSALKLSSVKHAHHACKITHTLNHVLTCTTHGMYAPLSHTRAGFSCDTLIVAMTGHY